jgi:hypothetical protein
MKGAVHFPITGPVLYSMNAGMRPNSAASAVQAPPSAPL